MKCIKGVWYYRGRRYATLRATLIAARPSRCCGEVHQGHHKPPFLYSMNEITIYTQSQPSAVKVYQGKRVITFKDIDTLHQRPEGTAGRNFRANRSRFIEGEDFYTVELTGDEIRRQFGAGKNAGRSMTVLTKKIGRAHV